MAIEREMNYIEFNNKKETLPVGYYRVEEADGDFSIAKVTHPSWARTAQVEWLDENEYAHRIEMENAARDTREDEYWDRAATYSTVDVVAERYESIDASARLMDNEVVCRNEPDPAETLATVLRNALTREMNQD